MPGQDVDDAALAEMGEGHLRNGQPSVELGKPAGHRLVHLSVATIREPIQVAALPSDETLEAGIQRSCDGSNLAEPDLIEPSVLDQGYDSSRNARSDGDIPLSQPSPDPDCPQSRADLLVIHERMMGEAPYLPVTSTRWPRSQPGVDFSNEQ